MKILIIHNHYLERGGEDEVVDAEVKLLRRFGHEVVFYERSNREIENYPFAKKWRFLKKHMVWSSQTYEDIKKLVKQERPDLAHIHNIFVMISPSVYSALSEEGVPIVQTLHNYKLFCPKGIFYRKGIICEKCHSGNFIPAIVYRCWRGSFILTFYLARMLAFNFRKKTFEDGIDAYIALSTFSKNKFIGLGLPERKIFAKPNFVNLEIEEKDREHEKYALFVGRFVDYKGVITLISAHERLKNIRIKMIGDGPLYEQVKEKIKKMDNVELLGRLSYDETVEYIKKSQFVIFPSECYENMPRVIIESFACGIPVIASRLGATAEIVDDHVTGLHFTPGKPKELASKIEWAWENPEKMHEMGRQAKEEYHEKYRADRNYDILMNIYKKTLAAYNR